MIVAYYIGAALTLAVLAFKTNAPDDMAYMLLALCTAAAWPIAWTVAIGVAVTRAVRRTV